MKGWNGEFKGQPIVTYRKKHIQNRSTAALLRLNTFFPRGYFRFTDARRSYQAAN